MQLVSRQSVVRQFVRQSVRQPGSFLSYDDDDDDDHDDNGDDDGRMPAFSLYADTVL